MFTLRFAVVLTLAVFASQARAQAPPGTPAGGAKLDLPPIQPNQQLRNGVPSLYGQGGTNQFYTPVGPVGSRANLVDAPPSGLGSRKAMAPQTPSVWQRFKNFIGLGNPPAPGTVPQQVPAGSANPNVFGGR